MYQRKTCRFNPGLGASVLAVLSLCGCSRDVELGRMLRDRGDAGGDSGSDAPGGVPAFCAAAGALFSTGGECTGSIAARAFPFALCYCETGTLRSLVTDSFEGDPTSARSQSGASVGANAELSNLGAGTIAGSLSVNGSLIMNGDHEIAGDLRVNDLVSSLASLEVAGNAVINGDLDTRGGRIEGDLTQLPGASRSGLEVAGNVLEQASALEPPCPCDGARGVDIAAIVDAARRDNDNRALDFASDRLSPVREELVLALPCGRLYLSDILASAPLTLKVDGHTALFVEGNLDALAPLLFDVGPQGSLDLFVKGSVTVVEGPLTGPNTTPSSARLYIAGFGVIDLENSPSFVGQLYAPLASVSKLGKLEVFGALLAGRVSADELEVHYDRSVLGPRAQCE